MHKISIFLRSLDYLTTKGKNMPIIIYFYNNLYFECDQNWDK